MQKTGQRQDIQGLRALAVALIVVFHLSATLLPGGYVGVDVFFVISGFLITGHLWRDVERNGTISLSGFWSRRIRRLLPASFLVLLVSAVLTLTVMPATLREQNLTEIGFAAIYALNWLLASNSVDYLAAENAPSLVQHYWTLSVEEQFYIVWPLLVIAVIWLALRCSKRRSPRQALLGALGLVFIVSLVFSIWETTHEESAAYFITTTRVWEFAAGGLVALAALPTPGKVAQILTSWAAATAILASAVFMNSDTAFPGWIALVPVLSTAALLWAGNSHYAWSPQRLAHFPPVQWLGDASYSVYLWHWPVIVVTTQLLGRPPGWAWASIIVAVTLLLAAGTKRWVEDPLRQTSGILKRPLANFGFMSMGMLIIAAVAVVPQLAAASSQQQYAHEVERQLSDPEGCFGAYAVMNECPNPYDVTATVMPENTKTLEHWAAFDRDPACSWKEDVNSARQGECLLTGSAHRPRVLMLGDSHAAQYLAPMLSLARAYDWSFELHSRSVCTGLGVAESKLDETDPSAAGCRMWSDRMLTSAEEEPYDAIIIAARPRIYAGQESAGSARLSELQATGSTVIVVGGVPGTGDGANSTGPDAPQCIEAAIKAADTRDPCAYTPEPWKDFLSVVAAENETAFIDPKEILCSEDGVCHSLIGGTIVYQDNNHLSLDFARSMYPWLDDRIAPLIEDAAR